MCKLCNGGILGILLDVFLSESCISLKPSPKGNKLYKVILIDGAICNIILAPPYHACRGLVFRKNHTVIHLIQSKHAQGILCGFSNMHLSSDTYYCIHVQSPLIRIVQVFSSALYVAFAKFNVVVV